MIYIMIFCVELCFFFRDYGCIFETQSGKETTLLLGGCGYVSGSIAGETRLCFVGLVKLGVRFVFRVGRIFFGSMFNSLNINLLWVTSH